jgi:hypothetical protein
VNLPAQHALIRDFYQLVHDVALEEVDHQQPFRSLPKVAQELTLQTHRPYLAVKTTKEPRIPMK